ncbi:hypothetical protein K402DRAFT_460132 [Aulographum hederae CBS 113979]|uniref:SUI1 domain-containing protein n=1 Tax=Aulographum hederae CBS 113979 TaxID=1176131 RepID=A0A6G1HBU6_9PEZI|nr:hypothetical protein K402DRAFT_460132 [Aulographum hederae CBS 113979]
MFKKKPNIKPLSPIRSSDRRKLADAIINDLSLQEPASESATDKEKAAATAVHTSLRNSLLPENVQSARFTTTSGPELKKVDGIVYVGSHAGEDQRVLWVQIGQGKGKLYPTVYTLWHNAGILPLLHTHPPVVEKLQGGADLMTPGLANGPPFPSAAKKGAVVAVANTENPSVPVVVGVCEVDVAGLERVQGAKGVAVEIVHWLGDELWSWSAAGKPGVKAPEQLPGWLDGEVDGEEGDLAAKTAGVSLDDADGEGGMPSPEGNETEVPANESRNHFVNGEDVAEEVSVDKDMTTKEIDETFRSAFLYGVHHHVRLHPEIPHGLDYPLSQSFVMAELIQPFLPAFTPSQTAQLQIKKSSFKNIKKFIKSLDKGGLLKSKDRDGNSVVIQEINFAHPELESFKPYRLPKKETAADSSQGWGNLATTTTSAPSGSNDDPSLGQTLKILSLFRPKPSLIRIFTTPSTETDVPGLYTSHELKTALTAYIEAENLISPTNRRLVTLDPVLSSLFDASKDRLDNEVLAKGSLPRDALATKFQSATAPFYFILRNNDPSQSISKPKAGAAPKVLITLETRSGNKTVTKISGLEPFYIMPTPLAEELKKVCAGSASVEKMAGSSAKEAKMEVMVQGPQNNAVVKALGRRGVDGKWIEVLSKTKGKKR